MPGNREPAAHVAVVGAGVAGLTAAWQLTRRAGDRVRVTVLDGAPAVGGKLRVSEVAGVPVDEGAESMLARRPEGVALVRELGAGDQLVEPGTTSAAIWADGELRPIPRGHVMGVPADVDAVGATGLFSAAELAAMRAEDERPAPPVVADVSVGGYVASRLGAGVVDRLVEPLLGGVYAGRADVLSLQATVPQLAAELRTDGSLLAAARRASGRATASGGPVFVSLRGGMGSLPDLLAGQAKAEIRTGAMVRALAHGPDGWRLTVGSARDPELVEADAVVLAVPARPASRLLAGVLPDAAADLAAVEYASMALVTFAYPAAPVPAGALARSGFLVPASAGRLTKAATFVSAKWPHVAVDGLVLVRCSVGRHGDERTLQVPDETLAERVAGELADAVGVAGRPVDVRVTRWGGALPQYAVGHLDRVARVTSAVAGVDRLEVCGAAYAGVGVPACVGSGREAADRVWAALSHR